MQCCCTQSKGPVCSCSTEVTYDPKFISCCLSMTLSVSHDSILTLSQSHVRVPLSETWQTPRLLQFIGHLYLEMEMVYLQVLESSPFTPMNHFPAHVTAVLSSSAVPKSCRDASIRLAHTESPDVCADSMLDEASAYLAAMPAVRHQI